MIENKHLRSYLQVLDLGSFSTAARSLNIAQPALSQHVQKLEEKLSTRLLNRGSRGVTPTPDGHVFAQRAREILSLVDGAERLFQTSAQDLIGEVRLGLPGSVCPVLAPELLLEARARFPGVSLIVTELMSGDLAELLRAGRVDAAILFNVQETDDYTSEQLFVEKMHLVGAPDAPLLQSDHVQADTLPRIDLVGTYPPHGLRLLLERWSSEYGLALNFKFEADAPSVLVRMAARGECYTIVSKAAIAHEISNGVIAATEVTNPPIERFGCFCSSKRVPPNRARDAMVELIRSVAKRLVTEGNWPGASAC
ncbi:MAG: LysR family transcriptional regulator [Pseudomonadota bacterium]